jgi:hypothetical protein
MSEEDRAKQIEGLKAAQAIIEDYRKLRDVVRMTLSSAHRRTEIFNDLTYILIPLAEVQRLGSAVDMKLTVKP